MKTILTTLNAKYIHSSLALRWLYVANKERFDIAYKEFIIKDDIQKIAVELLASNPDVIGMGIYIWNVVQSMELASLLKNQKPELILLAGGPEVSYDPAFFLNYTSIDFIISGEGEFVLGELLTALTQNHSHDHKNINIESVSHQHRINKITAKTNVTKLSVFPSPYILNEDLTNRIIYFETSRGCPYSCTYCLSSLEKGVRYFPLEFIFKNLEYLIINGVRQVKFLDRTFNLNHSHTCAIFDFLIERYKPGLTFQFEIVADLLTDELIDHLNEVLPPHYFRFEIGIQTTCEPTNRAVKRKQNFKILASHIRKLIEGQKVELHLDLIAGLPLETFDRFKKSFDDVFALGAKEVQLGFLKMLRGTSIRHEASVFGYQYNPQAPYEINRNDCLSPEDIKRLHTAERALELFWNSGKFKNTMRMLFDTSFKYRYLDFFEEIGRYLEGHLLPNHLLEDTFLQFHQFLQSKDIDLFAELREDYYACFKIRPHGFWKNRIEKKRCKQLRYLIGNDKDFLKINGLNRYIIEKQTAIDVFDENHLLLTVFCDDESRKNPLFLHYPMNCQQIITNKTVSEAINIQ